MSMPDVIYAYPEHATGVWFREHHDARNQPYFSRAAVERAFRAAFEQDHDGTWDGIVKAALRALEGGRG